MFETTLKSVVAVDTDSETIHFYSMPEGRSSIKHDVESYKARPFDTEFFEKFRNILNLHREKDPTSQGEKISLVLPDHVFLTDTVNIPAINRRAMHNSLHLAINSIYKNGKDIRFSTFPVFQNKQYATYSLLGIRKELLTNISSICDEMHVSVQNVTYAANAAVNAAIVLNPKLKNATFLLLDIKEKSARFAFVVKGKTMGYYSLPFGYSILSKTKVASEDLLFDHSPCDLLVLNAKEKARAKQLTTVYSEDLDEENEIELDENGDEIENASDDEKSFTVREDQNVANFASSQGILPKKTARKLPKFMLRPIPESREAFVYENFRIFVKWALDLITNNSSITAFGAPDTVYVNMPREYDFLFDTVNAEAEENKITFSPLMPAIDDNDDITRNLELFGGIYVKQYNKINNF